MEAKIYKSDWRDTTENHNYQCWSTFKNTDDSFGVLRVFNEEHLSANASISHKVSSDVQIMLIPIMGGIDFEFDNQKGFVHINQLQVFNLRQGQSFKIFNPYEKELVRYFYVQFDSDSEVDSFQNEFDLSNKNTLISIFKNKNVTAFLGIYDGRAEENFSLSSPENGLFTFIIQGAFEFQNRLLESGDALHLIGNNTIEFESLSENAMLLILEITNIQ